MFRRILRCSSKFVGAMIFSLLLTLPFPQPAPAAWESIDTFEERSLGSIHDQGNWVVNEGALGTDAFEVIVDPTDANNQVMFAAETIDNTPNVEDMFFELDRPLEDGTVGTLYFRFRTDAFESHINFGLSDVAEPTGTWNHFEAQIRDNQDGGLDFRDGGGFTNVLVDLPLDEWISVWMVIDNADDLTQNYIQTEASIPEQTQLTAGAQDEFAFRFGTDEPLNNFFLRAGGNHFGEWILDDIYLDLSGENLTDPNDGPVDPLAPLDDGSLTDPTERADYVHNVLQTWMGDANVDGEFNSGDLVFVFTAGKYETNEAAGWAQGDWDGDGAFGSSDFVVAFSDGGYEVGPRQAVRAVPEPSGLTLLLLAGLMSQRALRQKSHKRGQASFC